jgi:hypothetical protein
LHIPGYRGYLDSFGGYLVKSEIGDRNEAADKEGSCQGEETMTTRKTYCYVDELGQYPKRKVRIARGDEWMCK